MLVSMQYPSSKRKNPAVLRRVFASERFSLTFSQILRFVRRSPVASRLGCGLPGRKLSRLTPTNVGTLCAFLTGCVESQTNCKRHKSSRSQSLRSAQRVLNHPSDFLFRV